MRSKSRTKHLESELVQRLDRFVDFGLAAVLFVAPLAMAGRFAPGRLLLVAIVGATAIAWGAARYFSSRPQSWQVTGVEWLAAAAVFLVLLQSMPLPPVVVQNLSPAVSNLLPLHHGMQYADDGVPTESDQSTSQRIMGWTYLSVAPHATRGGLAMALTYVLLFGLVAQRLARRTDIEQLLKAIALAGVAMSLVGLLQRYLGNGKFLWFLEHPSRDTLTAVKGTFANENHFVHFLALSFGPLLWWLIREQEKAPSDRQTHRGSIDSLRERIRNIPRNQLLPIGGLCIVTLAALLSFSRGGLVMMTVAGAVTLGLFAWQRVVGMRSLMTFGLVTIVALAGVWINGQEVLVRELESLQTTSIESLDENQGRRKIWSAVLAAVPDFALLGSGVGSHRYIYPTYFKDKASVQYTHAESGYLQVLLETGGLGFALLLIGTGVSGYWIFRVLWHGGRKYAGLAVPLAASWTVSVVHAVFDFNWFIPANMTITLCILAMANRLSQKVEANTSAKRPVVVDQRAHWAVVTAGFSVVMVLSTVHFWGPARGHGAFAEYKAWSLATNRFVAKSTGPGRQRSLGFVDPSRPETGDRMIALLNKTVQRDPQHGRAHVRMAAICLRQFDLLQSDSESGMGLAEIRDAALQSEFESHQAMVDWVMRVAGENAVYLQRVLWHARRGIQLTPTEGRGYLYLSEVAFLDPQLHTKEADLMRQAYKVRPYDPSIQFVHGRYELLSGNQERTVALWKQAFRRGTRIRRRVIEAVASQGSVEEILTIFEPDRKGLRDLFEYYRLAEANAEMRFVGQRYVEALETEAIGQRGDAAGELWFAAQFVHATLGNVEKAVQAARNAVLAQPHEYRNHYACALRLRDAELWQDAVKEFRWCQQRKPQNTELPLVIAELQRAQQQAKADTAFHPYSIRSASSGPGTGAEIQ